MTTNGDLEAQELPFMGVFAGRDLREMSKLELMKAIVSLSRQHTKTLKTHVDDLEFFVA